MQSRARGHGNSLLSDGDFMEAQAVEQGSDGGAGVFAGCVEDAVGQGGLLELLLGLGAGVGFEVVVGWEQEDGRAVVAGARGARAPVVGWGMNTASATAPRTSDSRTTMRVPEEELRPEP